MLGEAPNACSTSAPTSNRRGPIRAPQPHLNFLGRTTRRRTDLLQRGLQHTQRQSAPTRMRRGNGPALRRGKQHRQAIGDLDCARHARLGGEGGIGFVDRGVGSRIRSGQTHHPCTMHLVQIHRRRADGLREQRPVTRNGMRIIIRRGAQIHAVERGQAHTAAARRHQRADSRHLPIRNQPIGMNAHAASGQAEGCVLAKASCRMHTSNTRITVGT